MKKLAILCIVALGAALMVLGTSTSASAYPELTCNVTVNRQVLNPGETFTVTGESRGLDTKGNVIPSSEVSWDFTWNGVTKHRTGAVASASFTAPAVTHTRDLTLVGRVTSPGGTCERSLVISVVAASVSAPGGGGSGLPNLGGPALLLLLAGLVLLLAGSGAVVASRRRGSPHAH